MKKEILEAENKRLFRMIQRLMYVIVMLSFALILVPLIIWKGDALIAYFTPDKTIREKYNPVVDTNRYWYARAIDSIQDTELKSMVMYGKNLIEHTALYLGPQGSVMHMSNGMNCQNCHLNGGTKIFGNNYGSVASLYPKFRARSGSVENIYKRVNDCFERSLNGGNLDTLSKEMQAIKSYIEFIGSNVAKGSKAVGSGFKDLDYLSRAADPEKGKLVYVNRCQSCHQANGQGVWDTLQKQYLYPPLWGEHSFNDGAGLFRISNFAKYVKYNMPQGIYFKDPLLSDDEAWDVAAFVNSQPRPHKETPHDWPDISLKPVDHPFGPYADTFSVRTHKYGPFKAIADAQKKSKDEKKTKS